MLSLGNVFFGSYDDQIPRLLNFKNQTNQRKKSDSYTKNFTALMLYIDRHINKSFDTN